MIPSETLRRSRLAVGVWEKTSTGGEVGREQDDTGKWERISEMSIGSKAADLAN